MSECNTYVVGHKNKHEEERQEHRCGIQRRTQEARVWRNRGPIAESTHSSHWQAPLYAQIRLGKSNTTSQQPLIFICLQSRAVPITHLTSRRIHIRICCDLPPALRRKGTCNTPINAARKRTDPLVEDAERDNGEEGEREGDV